MTGNEFRVSSPPTDTPSPRAPDRPGATARPAFRWSKTIVNFWLDSLLLVLFLALVWVSAVLRFLFPVGPQEVEWRMWGGDVESWRDVQFIILCLFSLGILLHVMLHWSWVCGVVTKHLLGRPPSRDDGSQTLLGVGVLLVILHMLAIGLLLAWYSLQRIS